MSQPKGMSSRLLTMKFMQRAAASGAGNNSSRVQTPPDSPSRRLDDDTSTPSSKRRKFENSPSHRASANGSDMDAISAAIRAEDSKRSAAIARQAADAGETEWVLEFPAGTIKSVAPQRRPAPIAKPMSEADAEGEPAYEGRKSYGGFKKKRQTEVPEPSEIAKSDPKSKDTRKDHFNDAVRIGQISSGGGNKGSNSHGGRRHKGR
ncbi:uncharacterized protein GIQ15_06623 [Arthroderma uncinatum]|uniref:uncharacterized protein n=1 Tax=Arthroderma uncinatum TaxID=74035 RepID=UPI00144A59B3|nr:uncharacterized protein GIQ15_06623 [Arthroderma uncinatum]KAF3479647.1 hypothetical protein GIQ15_06623 [Arthroderma uncinatum]